MLHRVTHYTGHQLIPGLVSLVLRCLEKWDTREHVVLRSDSYGFAVSETREGYKGRGLIPKHFGNMHAPSIGQGTRVPGTLPTSD